MARKLFGFFALAAVLAFGFVAVRALSAQAGGGMMGMMKDCPMMGAMAQGPEAALRHKDALGLTPQQVQRLEALRNTAPDHAAMMTRMQEIHAQIRAATAGEVFDEAAARAAFDRMGDLHTEMGVAMLRTQHQVRRILTPEQRETLAEQGGGMMGMMQNCPMMGGMMGRMHGQGGMHGGMMEDCPMMKGGMMGGHHGMKQEG